LAVPDTPEFRNHALHNNGNTFMQNVLLGLRSDPCAEVTAFSAVPVPSFPRGHRIMVWPQMLELSPGVMAIGVPFINITPIKQLSIGLSMLCHLVRWGWRERHKKHRVVFSFNISVPPLLFILAGAYLVRAKTMVYICDLNAPGGITPRTLLHRIDRLENWLLRFVDGGIVIADQMGAENLPGRPYIRVDGGASRFLIEETGRLLADRRLDEAHFTIVATGSLSAHNGVREILTAFSQLEGLRYRLVFAGRGELESEISAAAAQDPRIDFKGFLKTPDLLALHATADLLVSMRVTQSINTSYGFPSKTFEYLLSGVPVITTATGHMESEYGPYCFILKEETAEALAEALRRIEGISPAERRKIGATARNFMIEQKAWELQHQRIANYVHSRVR
jgi:glycosyltransferase involved in cell wall biosynthesis